MISFVKMIIVLLKILTVSGRDSNKPYHLSARFRHKSDVQILHCRRDALR